jgi:hypothetical protein
LGNIYVDDDDSLICIIGGGEVAHRRVIGWTEW